MARYNPLSYHNGSVWPHDTAIAVAGLRRAGFVDEALRLTGQLLSAATACDFRLPELMSGLTPEDLAIPIPYPASCSPQAWAAAAPLLLVRALLGLEPDLPNGRVTIDPRLPGNASCLSLDGVRLGSAMTAIRVDGGDTGIDGLPPGVALSPPLG
jgi:glycogen debranching enzyme